MFIKIGKSGGQSTWNARLADLEVGIGAKWYAGETGTIVFVTVVNLNTGETVERRGTMKVERMLKAGPGERLSEPVSRATVESLYGDVQGQDRTVKGAAEEYASRVAQIVAHEWAKKPALKPGDDASIARDFPEFDQAAARERIAFEAPELPTRAERWVDGYLDRIAAKAAAGHYRDAMAEAHGLTLQLHSMALLGPKGVDAIPVDPEVGDDAPAGAGYAVEAERG